MKNTETLTTAAHVEVPSLLLNVGSVLGGVLLLILVLAWLARRFGLTTRLQQGGSYLKVRATCSLGQRERVAIIEVENTWLVVGITANSITPLHTLDAPKVEPATETPTADFRQLMHNVLKGSWKK